MRYSTFDTSFFGRFVDTYDVGLNWCCHVWDCTFTVCAGPGNAVVLVFRHQVGECFINYCTLCFIMKVCGFEHLMCIDVNMVVSHCWYLLLCMFRYIYDRSSPSSIDYHILFCFCFVCPERPRCKHLISPFPLVCSMSSFVTILRKCEAAWPNIWTWLHVYCISHLGVLLIINVILLNRKVEIAFLFRFSIHV